MPLAREAVELLVQAARAWYFEGNQHGLRDREWMALRFLGRANRFSRTPSALAGFIGATRATASQIVKTLEGKSFLVRKPSHEDKRSVVLHVTAQGEKCLSQHDPINHVVNAVTALGHRRMRQAARFAARDPQSPRRGTSAARCQHLPGLHVSRRTQSGYRQGTRERPNSCAGCIAPRFRSRRPNSSAPVSSAPATAQDRGASRPRAHGEPGMRREFAT